jgi:hypothetical protein
LALKEVSNSFVFHLRSSLFILPLPSVIEQYTIEQLLIPVLK